MSKNTQELLLVEFAKAALTGLIACPTYNRTISKEADKYAEDAFLLAQSMLKVYNNQTTTTEKEK